jgi:flagellar basal-body rod protein FlgC
VTLVNISSLGISASGLSAQRRRMDAISNNLANANTTRTPEGGPYRRQEVVFTARTEDTDLGVAKTQGVQEPQIVEDSAPPRMAYEPGHPDADAGGYVRMPNVNIVNEMVDMISATRAYEANVTAIDAAKAMVAKALEIGR